MDWWTGMGGQRAAATFVGGPGDHIGSHHQLDVATAIFDPWLNTDDLDLGVILNQAGCATVTACPMPAASAMTQQSGAIEPIKNSTNTCQTFAGQQQSVSTVSLIQNNHQQHQHQIHQSQTGRHTDTHSRPLGENKRQTMNMVSNSTTASHSQQQQQQQNQLVMGHIRRPGDNSVAGSPLSSSLGSSPLNSHTNYLSSPHSSSSPPQNMNQNYGETHTNTDQNNNNTSVVGSLTEEVNPFTSVQHHNHHQNHQNNSNSNYFSESYIIDGAEHETSHTIEEQPSDHGHLQAGGAYMVQTNPVARPQIVYQDNIIVMTCPQQQHQPSRVANKSIITQTGSRTNCGSSLLSGLPSSSMGQRQGSSKLTTTRKFNNKVHSSSINNNNRHQVGSNEIQQQQPQKMRRCRHITDYVLAEEEKRLLIKEGHADFPMTCQARPLTKSEERILRKIRRKIRNKKSAQCSRQRKKEYVEELERKYAAILRENEELRHLLTGGVKVETTEFADQLDVDLDDQNQSNKQQQQQSSTLFEDHQQVSVGQQQTETFLDNSQSDSNEDHSEINQMNWKGLFPHCSQQPQQQQQL